MQTHSQIELESMIEAQMCHKFMLYSVRSFECRVMNERVENESEKEKELFLHELRLCWGWFLKCIVFQ